MKLFTIFLIGFVLILPAFMPCKASAQIGDLNLDFELTGNGVPPGWRIFTGSNAQASIALDTTVCKSGKNSLLLRAEAGEPDNYVYTTFSLPGDYTGAQAFLSFRRVLCFRKKVQRRLCSRHWGPAGKF